ncbi:hypothetical protein NA78x_004829 [Anatilimnocola sp. NA78]|uniref:hypothetical protein n=1 Tax=Anatilimnocola sp. NA78 TaxID=3415683 RepID=UPI003CE5AACA
MNPVRKSLWPWAAAIMCLLWLVAAGCGSKQLEDLAAQAKQGLDQAKQTAGDATKKAEEAVKQLPSAVTAVTAGEIKLVLDAPVNSTTCSARFTPPTAGRAGLLQIGTSVATGPQSFPAVYLHAPTDAADLPALVGKTLYGQLFVAKSESQGHYQSAADKPLAVQVVKVENNVVTCQLQSAEVKSLDLGQAIPVSGTLVGAIRP